MYNLLSFLSVLNTIGSVIIAILVLLLTITVHEFGHYVVGKIFKFKINEFAIGMGPAIYKKVKASGEIFSIRIFPLGGYCAFEGEDEDDKTTNGEKVLSPNAFNNKEPWKRILVLIAGASVNFICAILIIILNFSIYGHFALCVSEVRTAPQTEAYSEFSLNQDDIMTSIDGHYLYLTTDVNEALKGKKKGDMVIVSVVRDGERKDVQVMLRNDISYSSMTDFNSAFNALGVATVPQVSVSEGESSVFPNGQYMLRFNNDAEYKNCLRIYNGESFADYLSTKKVGDSVGVWVTTSDETDEDGKVLVEFVLTDAWASVDKNSSEEVLQYFNIASLACSYQIYSEETRLTFGEMFYRPFVYAFKTVGSTFQAFGQLITGNLPITDLSGPIGTITITSKYVGYGFNYLLEIASLIGISVAIFNLLPIPALDGARAVFVLIEWIRKKPINRKVEGIIHTVGLIVLLLFAVTVDVVSLLMKYL